MAYPKIYGRYILEERIAMGGMAEIFKAKTNNEGFKKAVCIKRILPHYLENEEFTAMFRDEAALAAKLQHGNIVQVFDFGEAGDSLYLAMELINGSDLRKILDVAAQKKITFSIGQCFKIGADMCKGLYHAHNLQVNGQKLGLVHRDISPHNVMVSNSGEVKITDFGIAKAAQRITSTSTGVVKGKLAYMSPEHANAEDIDHRADQFSTAIVLWEILTGRKLFGGETEAAVFKKVLTCEVSRPESIRQGIPQLASDVLMKALSQNPNDRYKDMRDFEAALLRAAFTLSSNPDFMDVRQLMSSLFSDEAPKRKTGIMDAAKLGHGLQHLSPNDEQSQSIARAVAQVEENISTSAETKMQDSSKLALGYGVINQPVAAKENNKTKTVVAQEIYSPESSHSPRNPNPEHNSSPRFKTETFMTQEKARLGLMNSDMTRQEGKNALASEHLESQSADSSHPVINSVIEGSDTQKDLDESSDIHTNQSFPITFPNKNGYNSDDSSQTVNLMNRNESLSSQVSAVQFSDVEGRSSSKKSIMITGFLCLLSIAAFFIFKEQKTQELEVPVKVVTVNKPVNDEQLTTNKIITTKKVTPEENERVVPSKNLTLKENEKKTSLTFIDKSTSKIQAAKNLKSNSDKQPLPKNPPKTVVSKKSVKTAEKRKKSAKKITYGRIYIQVTGSWAYVYKGKKRLGEAPGRIKLPVGKHYLTLKNPETNKKKALTVRVKEDSLSKYVVHF